MRVWPGLGKACWARVKDCLCLIPGFFQSGNCVLHFNYKFGSLHGTWLLKYLIVLISFPLWERESVKIVQFLVWFTRKHEKKSLFSKNKLLHNYFRINTKKKCQMIYTVSFLFYQTQETITRKLISFFLFPYFSFLHPLSFIFGNPNKP